VKIKYVDVIDDNMDDYPEIDDYLLKAGTRVLPLFVANGRIVNTGIGINYLEILEVLQEMGVRHSEVKQ
jgi:predicted nuclease with RNAse H fold